MNKATIALALVLVLLAPLSFVEAKGVSGGARSGGFRSAPSRPISRPAPAPRPAAPAKPSTVNNRASGFQNARNTTRAASPRQASYAQTHTTVNNYGGYGGGSGFFSGYLMGSMMHPFGWGYGYWGGGYGYGVTAAGTPYYPSTSSMMLSYFMSFAFIVLFFVLLYWFIKFLIRLSNEEDY